MGGRREKGASLNVTFVAMPNASVIIEIKNGLRMTIMLYGCVYVRDDVFHPQG